VPTVRSNAVLAVERTLAYSSTVAYLRSPDMSLRASARPYSKQAVQFYVRTHIPCVRTHIPCVATHLQSLLHICVAAIDRRSCARAHLSCCSSRPEAVYVFCFLFLFFYLIFSFYLLCLCLFIYLLFLVFVSIINCFNMLISLLINYLFSLFMLVFVYFIFVVIVSCGIF
jgi:hypothetical protein